MSGWWRWALVVLVVAVLGLAAAAWLETQRGWYPTPEAAATAWYPPSLPRLAIEPVTARVLAKQAVGQGRVILLVSYQTPRGAHVLPVTVAPVPAGRLAPLVVRGPGWRPIALVGGIDVDARFEVDVLPAGYFDNGGQATVWGAGGQGVTAMPATWVVRRSAASRSPRREARDGGAGGEAQHRGRSAAMAVRSARTG